MTEENCIFCKITQGEIPSAKVYEDDDVYAFLDLSQVTKGHTLIIPKTHAKDIYETSEETASALFARVPKVANAIKKTYEPLGINILSNTGEAAGQSVFHLHIHLIPRYGEGDGFKPVWKTNGDAYSQEDLKNIAESIQNNI
ncbi:protein hit [Paraliobacillus quinghaiensis]|uniref:Protein hit n=1 Tax=Paraliobacillus quinghaiensis TaxID=470815 RepID=A0A917TJ92_9BACI|nr:HIT family protein [Paraliobacillus quinghaiensis]GGM25456.1 protein hit [Paraliobacillus quinghaiensis]